MNRDESHMNNCDSCGNKYYSGAGIDNHKRIKHKIILLLSFRLCQYCPNYKCTNTQLSIFNSLFLIQLHQTIVLIVIKNSIIKST